MKTFPRFIGCPAIVAGVLFLTAAPFARAGNGYDTWSGGSGSGDHWSDAANWDPFNSTNTPPLPGDLLVFAGATRTTPNNDFPAGTPFNGITFDGSAGSFTLNGNAFTLTNGSATAAGGVTFGGSLSNWSGSAQTIHLPLTLTAGRHDIATPGGGALNLNGSITRNPGAVVVFAPGANVNLAGGMDTNNGNNILGAWATIGNDWATLDANSNVVAYAGYTIVSSGVIPNDPTVNLKYVGDTANLTAAAGTAINSLVTEQSAARSLIITNQLRLGSQGGIFRDGAGSGVMTITGGSIVAAGGGELTFYDTPFNAGSGNNLNIASVISNDTANVVSVNIIGYVQISQATNTYSGGTRINQGRVQTGGVGSFGSGPVYVYPGGQAFFNVNGTYTNDFFIAGIGTPENNGLGAFRINNAARIISGRVTLMGDATIGGVGNISGPITGTGNLSIGHGSSGNGHGVIAVGGATPNSYTGDTIINGSASQAADTLQINAGFNNVMPHGSGKGNLILNAGSATASATFNLNGTTQTINGLTNTAASPANDVVTNSSATAATLIVGDNDATSVFGGKVVGALSLVKVGNGTLTLNGANAYSGNTTVNGGALAFGAGAFSAATPVVAVNSNAILDVSAVCPLALGAGQSLAMNDGTIVLTPQAAGSAIITPALTAGGTSNQVVITAIPAISTYPVQFPVIQYTTLTGALNFGLAGLPASPGTPYAGYISNNAANNSVDLVITAGPSSIQWRGYSGGAPNSAWDTSTLNWATFAGDSTLYSDGKFVLFPDNASNGVVNVNQNVAPAGITVSNNSLAYTFGGGNKITGSTGLIKQGPGLLVLDNGYGQNDFTGDIAIGGGTLQVGNNDYNGSLPAGSSVVNNGALVFNRGALTTVSNNISGAGSLTQAGGDTVTLVGNNTFTGNITVASNSVMQSGSVLQLGGYNALGVGSVTVVSNNCTLDLNGYSLLNNARVVARGAGANGNGAVNNSSGTVAGFQPGGGVNYVGLTNLTLVGDTTLGATGARWDLRSPGGTAGNPGTATLSTGGQPCNLTKVGAAFLGFVSATVDTNLANIDIQQGQLQMEGNTTGLGNPTNTLTVEGTSLGAAAIFSLYDATNQLNKVVVVHDGGTLLNAHGVNTIVGPVTFTNSSGSPSPACFVNVANGAGYSLTLSGPLTGDGILYKVTGTNLLTLSGNSPDFAGGVSVGAGTLAIGGVLSNALGVTMNGPGTLIVNGLVLGGGITNSLGTVAGTGVISNSLDSFGVVAPGGYGMPGTLTVGGLNLEGGAQLAMDLNYDNTPGGGTNDLIVVQGDVTINANQININPLTILKAGVPYRLITYTGHLIWNGDAYAVGVNNYTFMLDTNTPGQINLIASGGPAVWNGGSVSGNYWSDAANWSGVTLVPGSPLYFDGSNRLNNTNDTAAGNNFGSIAFLPGAGAFTLNGNPIALGDGIVNNSTNAQTINLGVSFSAARTFNGGGAGLIIGGGVTNTAGVSTLTLAGAGTLANLIGCVDPTTMTNIISIGSTDAVWTLVDNPSSMPNTTPVQLDLLEGVFNFGTASSAPVLVSTANANNFRLGVAAGVPATFNMVNGTLTTPARLNTGAGANTIANLNQSGGVINVALLQVSDSSAAAYTTINLTGGALNVSDAGGFHQVYLASRGTGVVSVASSAVLTCSILDVSRNAAGNTQGSQGTVNLNAGGVIACSRVGTATSAAQAGPPSTGIQPSATFNFNGGVLVARGSSSAFFQGNVASPAIPITAIVKSGGAIIDDGGNTISVLEPLQHDAALGVAPDGGLIKLGGGTLTIASACTYNGDTVVSNGTLAIAGSLGATAVTVANGTLAGAGSIGGGVTVNPGGTIAPAGIGGVGTLTVAGNVTLLGNAALDLNAATLTNDVLNVGGGITYGGALTVTNLNGALAAGQSFKLFNAASYSGAFSATNLPALGGGLGWVWNPAGGTLSVVSTAAPVPQITGIGLAGTTLTLTGSNGPAGGAYVLLESTNVALPLGQWTPVLTNAFDGSGNLNLSTNIINPANAQTFYILQTQ